MNNTNFDYDTFFADLENPETQSTHTTSPSTDDGFECALGHTPPMGNTLDDTVIDLDQLDIWPFNGNQSGTNDEDLNNFSEFLTGKNQSPLLGEACTFDSLFADFDSPEQTVQELSEQLTSPRIPAITNCIKISSVANQGAATGPKCIKIEPLTSNIKLIKTSQPITLTSVPMIQMSLAKPLETAQPSPISGKRRRSDSPTSGQSSTTTITLDQLKAQYGNVNEETLKKHLRMIKNRESASLSRKRRKELMDTLDVRVKVLADENEQLKRDNSRLISQVQTLQLENKLLKEYKPSPARQPLILMGVVLLVVFNVFTIKSLTPVINEPASSLTFDGGERAMVPSRTILSDRRSENENSLISNNEHDYGPDGQSLPPYPYIQCVAYINKTHSKRINQDLRSLIQDQETKAGEMDESKTLTLPANPVATNTIVPSPQAHIPRKSAIRHQRQARIESDSQGQLQPYKTYEANYDEFIHTIDRKNDTIYFVSFKRDHLILPATAQNQTGRPKLSLILPASMANLNKSIHVPVNHVPMIKIDCEVDDTKVVFVKRAHIPPSFRDGLFQFDSSASSTAL